MRRRLWTRWMSLMLVGALWALPATGIAQDDTTEQESAEEQVEAEDDADADDSDGDDSNGDDAAEDGDAAPEVADEDADPVDDDDVADGVDELVDDDDDADEADEADDEPVIGPGGQELTSDYPGTEDSLAPQMETGEIEGVDIPDGDDPDEVYDLRVRELETQIDDLQERVFRSKSRIALLRETVLAENLAGSRAVITFVNDLGASYNVDRAIFSVDGSQVYSETDPEDNYRDGVEVFSGPVAPGTHTVSVTLGLRGSGYGVFSYAEGYEFDLRFSCQFTAEEGRTTMLTVQSYRSGNVFTAHEDRPDGVCEISMVELTADDIEDEVFDDPQLEGEEMPGEDVPGEDVPGEEMPGEDVPTD